MGKKADRTAVRVAAAKQRDKDRLEAAEQERREAEQRTLEEFAKLTPEQQELVRSRIRRRELGRQRVGAVLSLTSLVTGPLEWPWS